MKTAYLICKEGQTLEERCCQDYAKVKGIYIQRTAHIKEYDITLQKAIINERGVNTLLVFDIALLSRNMEKLVEYMAHLLDNGITIVTCTKGTIKPYGEGRYLIRMLDSIHYEYLIRQEDYSLLK